MRFVDSAALFVLFSAMPCDAIWSNDFMVGAGVPGGGVSEPCARSDSLEQQSATAMRRKERAFIAQPLVWPNDGVKVEPISALALQARVPDLRML